MKRGDIQGLLIQRPFLFDDHRGSLIKTFPSVSGLNFSFEPKESFYSRSNKNVIRGLHVLKSDEPNHKLVHVISGKILDVCLDLRKSSPSYLNYQVLQLDSKNPQMLLVPDGVAHGYLSLEEDTLVHYLQTAIHQPQLEAGIRYDSLGFDWEVKNPVLSEKDGKLPTLQEYLL